MTKRNPEKRYVIQLDNPSPHAKLEHRTLREARHFRACFAKQRGVPSYYIGIYDTVKGVFV